MFRNDSYDMRRSGKFVEILDKCDLEINNDLNNFDLIVYGLLFYDRVEMNIVHLVLDPQSQLVTIIVTGNNPHHFLLLL